MLKLSSLHEKLCFLLVCVLVQCHSIGSHQENVVNRMDIATCLAKFDVKNDMIIKTAESRNLGAKFLDNADSLSKIECLHLCCETESCDVFVYEEKGQGECFLFHCGPPQDFRCKFSKHANYTSAVLSLERKVSSAPTASTNKKVTIPSMVPLTQNEIELKSLKGKFTESGNGKSVAKDTPTIATLIKAIPSTIKNITSHCGRFQFQCHSGDCIAIYNACDGIPQCEDGSDEGPECRSVTRAPEPTPNKPSAEGFGRVQLTNANIQMNTNDAIGHNREDPLTAPQWPTLSQSSDLVGVQQQYSDVGNQIVFKHNGGVHTADNILSVQPQSPIDLSRQPFPVNSKDTYHVWSNAAEQQMPEFPMKFPQKQQIFSQYQPDLLQKNIEVSDTSQIKNQPQLNWPNLPNLPSSTHLNHNNEEILPEKNAIGVIKDVLSDRKKDGKNLLSQSKSESKSTEDSDYNNNEEEVEKTTEPPKKKKKHRKANKLGKQAADERANVKDTGLQQMNAIHSGLQAEFMDHDGEADRPGGAVVSLALGILITIGLVMVVSCRTTTLRKRVRRGKGYAHDADFLVNGMYL